MMKKWITCSDLCSRWNINEYDLADIVFDGKLQSFYDDFSALHIVGDEYFIEWPDGQASIGQRIQESLTREGVTEKIFRISDVEKFERKYGISPHMMSTDSHFDVTPESTDAIEPMPHPPENSESLLKEHLTKVGRKGGLKPKIKAPILQAVKAYMKENQKTHNLTNERIAKKFCNKYNENNPNCVTVDEIKWEVYCSGNCIFFRIYESYGKKANNKEYSIVYTTFQNRYIPLAKKAISTDITQ